MHRPNPVALSTDNVSFRGLFLKTDSPPQIGCLLRLHVIPPDDKRLILHATAVHVAINADQQCQGVGLRLIGLDERWERLIKELRNPRSEYPDSEIRLRVDHMNALLKRATALR
jgi:hypothetical protein